MEYNFKINEKKWQLYWEKNKIFKTYFKKKMKKMYILDMFPYPSGKGLHVGHIKGYTATDILARVKRSQGYNVLHPIGWDAFGLPAEQYAIETNNDPNEFTNKNIKNFKQQIKSMGFSYDWDREINTTSPKYYKWTQWIFIKLFEKGLAYKEIVNVNWVPKLKTVISNEEVINGKSERGNYEVIRKPMEQWNLKITSYAERLLKDLELLDWPENIKNMQKKWIGKSEGILINFKIIGKNKKISIFTKNANMIFGVTFIVVSSEYKFINDIINYRFKKNIDLYILNSRKKFYLKHNKNFKEENGIFSGNFVEHPITKKKIPIWISDYILDDEYITDLIMGIPFYNKKDYNFAIKNNIKIINIFKNFSIFFNKKINENKNFHINSYFINGMSNLEANKFMFKWLCKKKIGYKKTIYKLHDWLFSRQRYWGEPIPIIYSNNKKYIKSLKLKDLPLLLPKIEKKMFNNENYSLKNFKKWLNIYDKKKNIYSIRESDTMPQWAGSSWYYLRYIDPYNEDNISDFEKLKYWLPVDIYIGGSEHAVLHLLYARFWHKFLYDLGIVTTKEPFKKLYNQGMILYETFKNKNNNIIENKLVIKKGNFYFNKKNNEKLKKFFSKMSKSKKNVINPNIIIEKYGADVLRLYEMSMGPLNSNVVWDENGLKGSKRFLNKVFNLIIKNGKINKNIINFNYYDDKKIEFLYQNTVKLVTNYIEKLKFNVAISKLIIFINKISKLEKIYFEYINNFIKMLNPFAPHICEMLWRILGNTSELSYSKWPIFNEKKILVKKYIEIVLQVNSKIRDRKNVKFGISDEEIKKIAFSSKKIQKYIKCKEIKKIIIIHNKLINIVIL